MRDFREQNFYELLEVKSHASEQEIEASYQRLRKMFGHDSVATYALFQEEELNLFRRRVEEAFRVLSNPDRRKSYNEELFGQASVHPPIENRIELAVQEAVAVPSEAKVERAPEVIVAPAPVEKAPEPVGPVAPEIPPKPELPKAATETPVKVDAPKETPAVAPVPPPAKKPPMPVIDDQTEFSGAMLRQIREARGYTIEKVAEISKINIFYLRSIENESIRDLPAEVYIRGYLRIVCSMYGLDAKRVANSFIARIDKVRKKE
jgi:hypothetical protein